MAECNTANSVARKLSPQKNLGSPQAP